MDKKKYDITIADVEMSIISDEREEFVLKLVEKLDSEVRNILEHSKRSTKVDAALLIALDYSCGKAKAEKRVRNLEAQIALYDANLRRMREENIKLKSALLGNRGDVSLGDITSDEPEIPVEVPEDADDTAEEAAEDTPSQLSFPMDDAAEAEEVEAPAASREDKLRQIADLLHRKDD